MLDVGCWMLVGWIIHVCISHQSDLGFYQGPIKLRLVYMDRFMNICFGFKVRPSLFCYRFDLIRLCWPEVSIPVLDFYVALGENIVCGF